jgi:arylformamidase
MLIRISRPLRLDTPLYPGTPPPGVVPYRSLEQGDSSGSCLITFHSHTGTHLDAPRHFCAGGATTADICGDGLDLEPALCLDVPRRGNQRIMPADLTGGGNDLEGIRALLIRTGEGSTPSSDPALSPAVHPWLDPGIAPFLRKACPSLHLVGIDTISVSSPAHREEGRACHRAFLCGTPPILLLEDLDLAPVTATEQRWRLRIFPWINAPLDGVPVISFLEEIC